MIFVTVGTNEARFDRLLQAIAGLELGDELLVQHGHSSHVPIRRAELVDFLSFDAMTQAIRRARIVVTHAGVGSVMVALANGKRPIVVPRRKAFGEAVDDHQLQLGHRFAEAGLVTCVETPEDLGDALSREQGAARVIPAASSLAADLREFLSASVGANGHPVRA
jgi:UDP-N-acetylglucosamine transferase subunit ALG13